MYLHQIFLTPWYLDPHRPQIGQALFIFRFRQIVFFHSYISAAPPVSLSQILIWVSLQHLLFCTLCRASWCQSSTPSPSGWTCTSTTSSWLRLTPSGTLKRPTTPWGSPSPQVPAVHTDNGQNTKGSQTLGRVSVCVSACGTFKTFYLGSYILFDFTSSLQVNTSLSSTPPEAPTSLTQNSRCWRSSWKAPNRRRSELPRFSSSPSICPRWRLTSSSERTWSRTSPPSSRFLQTWSGSQTSSERTAGAGRGPRAWRWRWRSRNLPSSKPATPATVRSQTVSTREPSWRYKITI